MPAAHFMLDDIAGSLRAICLFPLFVAIPGYAAAWALDLFQFRRRTEAFRIAACVPLSIAFCPVVTDLTGRLAGWPAVFGFYAAAALGFAWICGLRLARRQRNQGAGNYRQWLPFAAAAAVWLAIAVFSQVDLQIGNRLYYPVSALDNSLRTSFVHSVEATGIPPQNPLFTPGPPVTLRYHYFWMMMCSLVERLAPSLANARQALIGGTFWCGIGLMGLVALYLRLFANHDPARFRKRALTAILLLGITGLDIIPTFFLLLLHLRGWLPFVLPSVEWWNEHVDWFLYSALWAPHALASLLAAMMGLLLLWQVPVAPGRAGFVKYSAAAAVALASSIGESIYVAFVMATFLAAWTVITIWKKWRREAAALILAGVLCAILALPYLLNLREPAAPNAGDFPLQFTVRAFSLAALVPTWGLSAGWRLVLVNGALLPLNYLLEFGFFFLAGQLWWRKRRASGRPFSRADLASVAMVATATLICSFLRSSVIGCNDLGWRGFLVAQFVLVLWATDLLTDFPAFLIRHRAPLILCLELGVAGVVYDLAITRVYPILSDRGLVPALDWMGPDRQIGRRTYAAREAYEWAHRATPQNASIQFNPHVAFEEATAMLYGDRRMLAGDMKCVNTFGGDPGVCKPIVDRLELVYTAGGDSVAMPETCAALPIDLLVAKDTDPVWRDRTSWVWTERPAFANDYMRMFRCRKGTRASVSK
jgi:hypothetical protein